MVAEAGLEVDVAHEVDGGLGEMRTLKHEGLSHVEGALAVGWGLVAGVVEEEDGARAVEEVVEEEEECA